MIHRTKPLMFKAFLVDVQHCQIKYLFRSPHVLITSTDYTELFSCDHTGFPAGKECIQCFLLLIHMFFPIHPFFHLYFLSNTCRLLHLFIRLIKRILQIII